LFFFSLFLETEEQKKKPLPSLKRLSQHSKKNPALKAADYIVEAAQANIGGARSGLFPHIDMYEGFTRTNNPMLAVGSKLNQESFSSKDYASTQLKKEMSDVT